jgi:ABC-type thiamine transport system ATPase subunit
MPECAVLATESQRITVEYEVSMLEYSLTLTSTNLAAYLGDSGAPFSPFAIQHQVF